MIEVFELSKSQYESIYISGNVGLIGSVIYQQDGGAIYNIQKLLGEKVNPKIELRKENSSSMNNVFIIILRTFNKISTTTTTVTERLLGETSNRFLETSSEYGTIYISDGKVNESGEEASFNWLMFIVIPACGVLVIGLVITFICCCCKKSQSEPINAPKKEYANNAKNAQPVESQRTVHDGSNRDVVQPIYMPSDRSLGGKPLPLESTKNIPKTQENSLIMDNATPQRSRENSPDNYNHYNVDVTPDRTPEITPQDSPGRTPQDSPGRTPQDSPDRSVSRRRRRRTSRNPSQENSRPVTPSKSPKRRVARRRYNQ